MSQPAASLPAASRPAGHGARSRTPLRRGLALLAPLLAPLVLAGCVDGSGGTGPNLNPVLPLSQVEFAAEFEVDTLDFVRGTNVLVRTDVPGDSAAAPVAAGNLVRLYYEGWTSGGARFDAHTPDDGDPLSFRLGAPRTLPGLTQGLLGMRDGEERTVLVAPAAGFGPVTLPGIPANSWLVLRIQLVERVEESDDDS